MTKSVMTITAMFLLLGFCIPTSNAYDIPQRKIEVKPYLSFMFPSDIWQKETGANVVDNKTAPGFGLKMRTQFNNRFGIVFNAAYLNFEVPSDASGGGALFTAGAYYAKSLSFGNVSFDCSYGIIAAADEALGLLMPTLEYSRPVSDRVSIALELGWPIANDWLRDFAVEESYSSLSVSLGTIILF